MDVPLPLLQVLSAMPCGTVDKTLYVGTSEILEGLASVMKLIQAQFSKEELDKLSKEDQVFFVQLTHLLDELTILQKCVIFSSNTIESKDGIERTAQRAQAVFFIRTLAGKIHEGWPMLHGSYFAAKLSQKYEHLLSKEARNGLDQLKKYFGKNNLIHEIRNKYAFHYDRQKVEEEINRIDRDEVLSMLISEQQGNNLFAFSDTIINSSILQSINPNDPQKAMDALVEEVVLKVCGWFQKFGHGFIQLICEKFGFNCIEVELSEVSVLEDIDLPYFIRRTHST